jgi:hypothetical protein
VHSFVAVALLATTPSCIAVSARARVGATTDDRGTGVQAGVALGFGYSGERSAVVAMGGVVTGTAPKLGVLDEIDYVRLAEHPGDIGWRAGIGGWLAAIGEPSFADAHLATLFVVRDRVHRDSSEKGWLDVTTRNTFAFGIEGGVGVSTVAEGAAMHRSLAGTAAATFEVLSLSTWR